MTRPPSTAPPPGAARIRHLAAWAMLVACPLTAQAQSDAPDSLRALLSAAGPAPASADTTWSDLEELLVRGPRLDASLADGETVPDARPEVVLDQVGAMSCGTPLMRAAERALLRTQGERLSQVSLLLTPPRFAVDSSSAVPGEPLVMRWDASAGSRHGVSRRDADGDRMPDAVQGAMDDARAALRSIVDVVGSDRMPALIEVRLAATPFAEGAALASSIVVPRQLRGPERFQAIAHQLAHVLVRQAAPDAPASFEEAVATWLGETALARATGASLPAHELLPARHPARTLLSPGIGGARSDAAFLRYVAEVTGLPAGWMADVLAALPRHAEDARRSGRSPADASASAVAESLDEVLSHHGLSLAEAVLGAQAWSLEQDLRRLDRRVSVDAELDRLPEETSFSSGDFPPFSQRRFGVALPQGGGVRLAFEPGSALSGAAVALFDDGAVRRFPLQGARDAVTLPASALRRLVVLVSSPEIPRAWSRWPVAGPDDDARLTAGADASWPFVLSQISAEPAPGQVTLSWDTSSEQDVVGWTVERALRLAGPWSPVTSAPFPASSWGAEASYAFVDATARPSLRYHYRVRALLRSGLSEASPSTSLRTLPPAR